MRSPHSPPNTSAAVPALESSTRTTCAGTGEPPFALDQPTTSHRAPSYCTRAIGCSTPVALKRSPQPSGVFGFGSMKTSMYRVSGMLLRRLEFLVAGLPEQERELAGEILERHDLLFGE